MSVRLLTSNEIFMLNKKLSIAKAAEQLFAQRGYEHTSTLLIAKEAGVSDALIFKHFGSKDKLLEHLIKSGYRRIVSSNRGILQGETPLDLIHNVLDLPAKLVAEEPLFWELQYRLIDLPLSLSEHSRFLQPVHKLLVSSFKSLGYANPEEETLLLLLLVDALWKKEVINGSDSTRPLRELMKKKYASQV